MADSFNFELVSPERLLVSVQATAVVIPGTEGEMTVMANHAPTMTTIKPGIVSVTLSAGATERYVVFGGFADITPAGCTLLAESAFPVADVSREDIARRVQQARELVAQATGEASRQKAQDYVDQLAAVEGMI